MHVATFDTDTLRLMTLFENITHAPAKDCIVESSGRYVYFVVPNGKVGSAIGRNGANVKSVQAAIKKDVKIFEFSDDLETFVRNLIPQARDVKVSDAEGGKRVEVKVEGGKKALVIGREGKNIKLFKELLRRNHDVDDLVVR